MHYWRRAAEALYIKIINIRDTDEKIIDMQVELEELDKITTSRLKNPGSCDQSKCMQLISLRPMILRVHEIAA